MKKLLCLILFCSLSAFGYPAKVVGISDGDTCTVLTADNQQVKIWLARFLTRFPQILHSEINLHCPE